MSILKRNKKTEINEFSEASNVSKTEKKDIPRETPEDYESCKADSPRHDVEDWEDSAGDDFESCKLENKEEIKEENEVVDDYSGCGIEDTDEAEETEETGTEGNAENSEETGTERDAENSEETGTEEKAEETEPKDDTAEVEEKTEQKPEKALEDGGENDELTELREASGKKAMELEKAEKEKAALEESARQSFEELMDCDRSDPLYKEKLSKYNSIRRQIETKEEGIIELENEKGRLDKSIAGKEHDILNEGDWAAYYSTQRANLRDEYQRRFDDEFYEKKPDKKELGAIKEDNERLIQEMKQEKDSLQRAQELKMEQLSSYIIDNGLSKYEADNDPTCQKLSAEYLKYQEAYHRLDYSIVKLEDNNLQIREVLGEKPEAGAISAQETSKSSGEDLAAWSGVANVNFDFGEGGGHQYFVPGARDLKAEGRLQVESVEYDNKPSLENTDFSTAQETAPYRVHIDRRPLTEADIAELKQMDENTPDIDALEKRDYVMPEEDREPSDLEIAQLNENTIDTEGLYNVYADPEKEKYAHPHIDQEDSNGLYYPDGWKAERIEPGTRLYQLTIDGDSPSSYFTDEVTVDSCRDSNGEVDFDKLRSKLQVADPERKIRLTKYVYEPENIKDTSVEAGLHKIDEEQEL